MRFGRAHFNDARDSIDKQWLSPCINNANATSSYKTAIVPAIGGLPIGGLGWQLVQNKGTPVLCHSGSTWGQCAMLFVLPEQNIAIAIQQNATNSISLGAIATELMQEVAGIDISPEPIKDEPVIASELHALTGTI